MKISQNPPERSRVKVLFREGFVHSFGPPGDSADIDRGGDDHGPADCGEVQMSPGVRGMVEEFPEAFAGEGETAEFLDGEIRDCLAEDEGIGEEIEEGGGEVGGIGHVWLFL